MAYSINPKKNMSDTMLIIIPDIKNHNSLFVVKEDADYPETFHLEAYLKNVPILKRINGDENESDEILDNSCKYYWKNCG